MCFSFLLLFEFWDCSKFALLLFSAVLLLVLVRYIIKSFDFILSFSLYFLFASFISSISALISSSSPGLRDLFLFIFLSDIYTIFLSKSKENKLFTRDCSYKVSVKKEAIILKKEKINSIRPPTSPNASINFVYVRFIVITCSVNWIVISQYPAPSSIEVGLLVLVIIKVTSYLKAFLISYLERPSNPIISVSLSILIMWK